MFPLFSLLTGVLCLLPRAETTNPYDHVLDGCTDLKEIAFKDWGHRAFLFAIIIKTAGYGNDLLYYCEREREIALWSRMDGNEDKLAAGTLLLDHTAKNWYHPLPAQASQTQEKKKTIGCEYDTNKKREVLCFAL
ncbi:hypothetical protein ANCCAN_16506 [Ancylostoma caninum]|uniref:Uncharacterized protein n=1 Tax=Ancylostoma caninum TaxID=29170 RepID=A0A368G3K8_ANCCA|nr:hypothetical protein ANCCAN_16506 [Ancylostoma caninum]